MTANTGRTVSRWTDFIVDDSNGTLRSIPVSSVNGVGLDYPATDMSAWQDAIKGALPEVPECVLAIEGPFDTTAAQTVGTLSGSHTILNGINGWSTPLTLDIQCGVRHDWESGEPQFGITSSAANGFLCRKYTVDLSTFRYSAEFIMFPGSTAPAWGTTSES